MDGATWPIAVLTSAFCPEFDPQKLAMAMCVGYFAGGPEGETAARFAVSGFVSSKARWREFETSWSRILRREGIASFNADDFLAEKGALGTQWSGPASRRALMDVLGRLAERHIFRAFEYSITVADYQAVNADYAFREAAGGPYAVCAAALMVRVRQWMATTHPDDLTLFVFEQGELEQRELQRILKAERAEIGEPPQIWPRQWLDERGRHRYLRPLEACLLFAADREGVLVKRLSERSILESHVIGRSHLAELCGALRIGPRFDTLSLENRTVGAR